MDRPPPPCGGHGLVPWWHPGRLPQIPHPCRRAISERRPCLGPCRIPVCQSTRHAPLSDAELLQVPLRPESCPPSPSHVREHGPMEHSHFCHEAPWYRPEALAAMEGLPCRARSTRIPRMYRHADAPGHTPTSCTRSTETFAWRPTKCTPRAPPAAFGRAVPDDCMPVLVSSNGSAKYRRLMQRIGTNAPPGRYRIRSIATEARSPQRHP